MHKHAVYQRRALVDEIDIRGRFIAQDGGLMLRLDLHIGSLVTQIIAGADGGQQHCRVLHEEGLPVAGLLVVLVVIQDQLGKLGDKGKPVARITRVDHHRGRIKGLGQCGLSVAQIRWHTGLSAIDWWLRSARTDRHGCAWYWSPVCDN